MFDKIIKITPKSVMRLFNKLGAGRLAGLFADKYTIELAFQKAWAKEFSQNRPKVRRYWEKYRHLERIIKTCRINKNSRILWMNSSKTWSKALRWQGLRAAS